MYHFSAHYLLWPFAHKKSVTVSELSDYITRRKKKSQYLNEIQNGCTHSRICIDFWNPGSFNKTDILKIKFFYFYKWRNFSRDIHNPYAWFFSLRKHLVDFHNCFNNGSTFRAIHAILFQSFWALFTIARMNCSSFSFSFFLYNRADQSFECQNHVEDPQFSSFSAHWRIY